MSNSSRKYLTVIILLSITLSFLTYINLSRKKSVYVASDESLDFPLVIDRWEGRDISLSERVYELLGTKEVFMREYTNTTGLPVGLAIVRSDSDRSSFHPPEICYLGGGVELLDKTIEVIKINDSVSIKANKLIMKDKGGLHLAWYWFKAGENTTHNYYLQQLQIVRNGLFFGDQTGSLIRVSTRVAGDNLVEADARIKDFIVKGSRYF